MVLLQLTSSQVRFGNLLVSVDRSLIGEDFKLLKINLNLSLLINVSLLIKRLERKTKLNSFSQKVKDVRSAELNGDS